MKQDSWYKGTTFFCTYCRFLYKKKVGKRLDCFLPT